MGTKLLFLEGPRGETIVERTALLRFHDVGQALVQVEDVAKRMHWMILLKDQQHGVLRARTPGTLRSWGEIVEFRLKAANGLVEIHVASEPTAQLFDWGKGTANIAHALEQLPTVGA